MLALAVSADDRMLVTCSRSRMLRVWAWRTAEVTRQFKVPDVAPVVAVAFDATSTLLATGTSDGVVRVWDAVKGFATHVFRGSQGIVHVLRFFPDAETLKLFSAAEDGHVRVWDLRTSKCEAVLQGHASAPRGLAFGGDQLLFSAARDKVVNVWDWRKKKLLDTIAVFEVRPEKKEKEKKERKSK